jgi:hypothetical protein
MVKRTPIGVLFFYPDIYNKLYIMINQTWEILLQNPCIDKQILKVFINEGNNSK